MEQDTAIHLGGLVPAHAETSQAEADALEHSTATPPPRAPGGVTGAGSPAAKDGIEAGADDAADRFTEDPSIEIEDPLMVPTRGTLEFAYDFYARRGWAPIGIQGGQKRPLTKEWPVLAGTHKARELLEEGWNLGLTLGGGSRLADVDLDSDEAARLAPLFLQHTNLTSGRRSRPLSHRWYRIKEGSGLPRTRQLLDPTSKQMMVELRCVTSRGTVGHQTVVWPSTHPSGEAYDWCQNPPNLPEPAEVEGEDLIRGVHLLHAGVLLGRGWRPGQRHVLILAVAGSMAQRGHSEEDALDFLRRCREAYGQDDPKDVEKCVRDTFCRVGANQPATGRPTMAELLGNQQLADKILEDVDRGYGVEPRRPDADPQTSLPVGSSSAAGGGNHAGGLELQSIGELLEEVDQEAEWLVEERLPAGGTSIIAAKPKTGKSTMARHLTLCVARGDPWLAHRVSQGPVLYIALEGRKADVVAHLRKLGATNSDPIHVFHGFAGPGFLEALRRAAVAIRPALVVVDTLQRLLQIRDVSDYSESSNAFDRVLEIARDSAAHVLLIHHMRKSNGEGTDQVLGSTALAASVDTVLKLERNKRHRFLTTVQRVGPDVEDALVIDLEPGTDALVLRGTRSQAEEARVAELIVEYLESQAQPVTQKQIRNDVRGRGEHVRAALTELVRARKVLRSGGGRKGDPYVYIAGGAGPLIPVQNQAGVSPDLHDPGIVELDGFDDPQLVHGTPEPGAQALHQGPKGPA